MNPRTELEKRYPEADFTIYFRHLEACRTLKGRNTHEHHICPKKQFPEYTHEPANKIVLAVEDHAFAHKLLTAAVPELSNIAAWIAACDPSKAGKRGGAVTGRLMKEKKLGIFAISTKACVIGGSIAGKITKEKRTGIFAPGMQAKGGQIAGLTNGPRTCHKRWHIARGIVSNTCTLCAQAG